MLSRKIIIKSSWNTRRTEMTGSSRKHQLWKQRCIANRGKGCPWKICNEICHLCAASATKVHSSLLWGMQRNLVFCYILTANVFSHNWAKSLHRTKGFAALQSGGPTPAIPKKILWIHLSTKDSTFKPASAAKESDQNTHNTQYLGHHKDDLYVLWPLGSLGDPISFDLCFTRIFKDTAELQAISALEKSPYNSAVWRTIVLLIANS